MTESLQKREQGYQWTGSEYHFISEKEKDRGYVRYRNKDFGIFCLDPSPYMHNPYPDLYVVKGCSFPPEKQLIDITVRETGEIMDVSPEGYPIKIPLNYVLDWKIGNPKKMKKTNLVVVDEFLDFLSTPIKPSYFNIEDLEYCLGMYAVSSPQFVDFEPGGINAVVLRGDGDINQSWWNFRNIMKVIPDFLKNPTSTNFYAHLESKKKPKLLDNSEISLSYKNIKDVPVQIPLPFKVEFKNFFSYKDYMEQYRPMATAYMMDALLYQPFIPPKYEKRIEESMYYVVDFILDREETPCFLDLGSVVPKMATAFARLKYKKVATIKDLDEGKNFWANSLSQSKADSKENIDKIYTIKEKEEILFSEINELNLTGIKVTYELLKEKTKLLKPNFKKAFNKLRACGYIYTKPDKTIGIIEH
ncbi:MAG: hypothetical protein ACPK85_12195 [Methanosarcina sp.]